MDNRGGIGQGVRQSQGGGDMVSVGKRGNGRGIVVRGLNLDGGLFGGGFISRSLSTAWNGGAERFDSDFVFFGDIFVLHRLVNISKRSMMIEGEASVNQRDGGGGRGLRGLSGLFSRDKGHEGTEYESLHSFEYLEMETPRAKSRVEPPC